MISTIRKFPWYMENHITLGQRYTIYETCTRLITLLMNAIRDRKHEERLTQQLLKRLTNAAMLCPGFTVLQKDNIATMVKMEDMDQRQFNQPRFANLWLHQYVLGPKPGVPLDVLEVSSKLPSCLCTQHGP